MDSILSVRINEDLKNKFILLAEEAGTNNKEFMDLIIRSYEMNKTAEKTQYVKNDVDELQSIIKRILDIYVNLVERNNVKLSNIESSHNDALQKEAERAIELEREIESLKQSLQKSREDTEKLKSQITDAVISAEKERDNANEYKELNSMLKQKLTDFHGISEENMSLINENNSLKDQVLHLKETNEQQRNDIQDQRCRITDLEEQLKIQMDSRDEALERVKDQTERKYQLSMDEISLNTKSEIFQKEEAHRAELWNLKNEYESRISALIKDKELLLNKLEAFSIKNRDE